MHDKQDHGAGIPRAIIHRVLSRRQLIRAAGASALALGARAWAVPADGVRAAEVIMPRPIPGGTQLPYTFIHHYPLTAASTFDNFKDPSQIYDFDGIVALNRVLGMGTATDTRTGATALRAFQADTGFMQGTYVGEDGQIHTGSFGFI
jgi:hypothetical protein